MSTLGILCGALVLDAILGDPDWPGHPVRLIGRLASGVEGRLRPGASRPVAAGAVAWFVVVGLPTAIAAALVLLARLADSRIGPEVTIARDLVSVLLVYVAIAPRDLARHAMAVARALRGKGLDAGRAAVGRIVGRDTERLDGEGVVRACVESVAESSVDGVTAPLFWAALLGPAGAIAYRAVNTLDSMWGHKDARYRLFGKVAARADDVANWLPARLSFLAAWIAAALAGFNARKALFLGWRDRRKHESPNAAWLEASFAGALGIELGGPAWYSGAMLDKPRLGTPRRLPEVGDIGRSVVLMYVTAVLFALVAGILAGFLPWNR